MGERVKVEAKKPEVKQENLNLRMRGGEYSQSMDAGVERILYLQRTIGNQAVQRLVRSGALQAKLRIGQPGDVYEQEADRVADAVMQMPEPEMQRQVDEEEEEEILQTKPLVDQITPLVQRQVEEDEEEEMLQAKSREDSTSEVSYGLESQINAIKGGGRPLGESERAYFEPRFGADFSPVRVHTGAQADESIQSVNARAFTVGRDIVFGPGQYSPGTIIGKRLLAHELTHAIQQRILTDNRASTIMRIPIIDPISPLVSIGMGFLANLIFARSLETRYPGWRDALPDCPCTDEEAQEDQTNWIGGLSGCPFPFHIGATTGYRSARGYPSSVPGTSHGQQCCYNDDGNLITEGPGAGTPDLWSPRTESIRHQIYDVKPWIQLGGWRVYNRYWIPNKGQNCPVGGKVLSKPPVTPTLPVSPTSKPKDIQIFFKKNRPKPDESGKEHLNNSLTITGKKQLERLVAQIRQNPTFRVQLVGKASPEGTSKFNLDLGARRANIIAGALINEGIDRTRFMNLKVSECKVLGEGLVTCGEAGAIGPSDRQVLAKIFVPKL